MDEERLIKDIEQYKEQFLQVQNVLQAIGEDGQEELVKLRDDFVELIHVSEDSLLSLKKSKLLKFLDEQEPSASSSSDALELNTAQSESQNNENIEEDDIIGTKCRVSYTQEWGVTEHHNAMVFNVEIIDDDNYDPDQAKVRILFLNPTHISMVPCPYFLDGKCRFKEDECRYSHGYLVNVEDLKPFREPNFSDIEQGQQCLARYTDGVWYKSTIKSINHKQHEFVVHYDTYNTDGTLGMDNIFPIDNTESPEDSDDDTSSLSSDDSQVTDSLTNDDIMDDLVYDWKPTGMSLGDWEQHTRGIGSKLMAKMGYIFGKGLGKDGDGRVEPVEVVVLPQGKSLDACAELREKKKLKEPFKKKKKKVSVKVQNIPKQGTVSDVFTFLNHKFGGSKGNIQDIKAAAIQTTDQFDIKDRTRKKANDNDKNTNWNIKLLKIHEEISAAEKQLQKTKQAHQRQSMDKSTSCFFKKKVDDMEHHIMQLKTNEKLIKQKIHQKQQHRKLTTF